jgi:hypothetical protein
MAVAVEFATAILGGCIRIVKLLLVTPAAVALATAAAAAAQNSLLPPVGSSLTLAVRTHTDFPSRDQSRFEQPGPGGPPPSGGGQTHQGGFRALMRDQNGTLTLQRQSTGSLLVTTGGDVDQISSPLSVSAQGTIAPGDNPNRFVVALDNAIALAQALPAGPGVWHATLSLLMPPGALDQLPVQVKVVSSDASGVKLEGSGSGTVTITTPRGERPVDVKVTADEQLSAGRLAAYTQEVEQAFSTPSRTMTITNTVTLTSQ